MHKLKWTLSEGLKAFYTGKPEFNFLGNEVIVCTRLSKYSGGEYYEPYGNHWVWYKVSEGFKPRSGKWWTHSLWIESNFRLLRRPNPIIEYIEKNC